MESAKTLFASLRDKARNAEFARMQLEELKTAAAKCTPVMHLAPSGGGESRTLENNVIRIEEAERRLQSIVDDYEATKAHIQNLICALDDAVQQTVLQQRYINGLTWPELEKEIHYSDTYLRRLNKTALTQIDSYLKRGP